MMYMAKLTIKERRKAYMNTRRISTQVKNPVTVRWRVQSILTVWCLLSTITKVDAVSTALKANFLGCWKMLMRLWNKFKLSKKPQTPTVSQGGRKSKWASQTCLYHAYSFFFSKKGLVKQPIMCLRGLQTSIPPHNAEINRNRGKEQASIFIAIVPKSKGERRHWNIIGERCDSCNSNPTIHQIS